MILLLLFKFSSCDRLISTSSYIRRLSQSATLSVTSCSIPYAAKDLKGKIFVVFMVLSYLQKLFSIRTYVKGIISAYIHTCSKASHVINGGFTLYLEKFFLEKFFSAKGINTFKSFKL